MYEFLHNACLELKIEAVWWRFRTPPFTSNNAVNGEIAVDFGVALDAAEESYIFVLLCGWLWNEDDSWLFWSGNYLVVIGTRTGIRRWPEIQCYFSSWAANLQNQGIRLEERFIVKHRKNKVPVATTSVPVAQWELNLFVIYFASLAVNILYTSPLLYISSLRLFPYFAI